MAKNVQIIPVSGSLDFINDSGVSALFFQLDNSDNLALKSGSIDILTPPLF